MLKHLTPKVLEVSSSTNKGLPASSLITHWFGNTFITVVLNGSAVTPPEASFAFTILLLESKPRLPPLAIVPLAISSS